MSAILPLSIQVEREIHIYGCEFLGAGIWAESQLQKTLKAHPDKALVLKMSERKDPIALWSLQDFQQKYQCRVEHLSINSEKLWAEEQVKSALNMSHVAQFSRASEAQPVDIERSVQLQHKEELLMQRFDELFSRHEWLWRRALAQAISESPWYRLREPRLQAMLKIQSMDFGRRKGSSKLGMEVNPSLQWYAQTDTGGASKKVFFMGINPKSNLIFEFEGEPWMAELIDFIEDHRNEDITVKADERVAQAQELGLLI